MHLSHSSRWAALGASRAGYAKAAKGPATTDPAMSCRWRCGGCSRKLCCCRPSSPSQKNGWEYVTCRFRKRVVSVTASGREDDMLSCGCGGGGVGLDFFGGDPGKIYNLIHAQMSVPQPEQVGELAPAGLKGWMNPSPGVRHSESNGASGWKGGNARTRQVRV